MMIAAGPSAEPIDANALFPAVLSETTPPASPPTVLSEAVPSTSPAGAPVGCSSYCTAGPHMPCVVSAAIRHEVQCLMVGQHWLSSSVASKAKATIFRCNCTPYYLCHPFQLALLLCTGACEGTVSVTLGPSLLVLSDGPGVYANNMQCAWLVEAPGPIRVVFTHFHTESDSDFLKIYGGTGDDATILRMGDDEEASFSGAALPESFTTNSTSLKIVFESDVSVSFSGFELELSALAPGGMWVPTVVPTAAPTWAPEAGAAPSASLQAPSARTRLRHVPAVV
jgi:hypothetical protein